MSIFDQPLLRHQTRSLEHASALYDAEYNSDNCYYQQHMNQATGTIAYKAYCPANDEYYCYEIK